MPPARVAGTGSYTGTQDYRFYHPAIHGPIGDGKYTVLDKDGQPHAIVRTVYTPQNINGVDYYQYSVSKQGKTADIIYHF